MIAAVVILGLVCGLLICALVLQRRDHDRLVVDLGERAAVERSELATRIQHPEFPIFPRGRPVEQPEPPKDAEALAQVGVVLPFRDDDGDESA